MKANTISIDLAKNVFQLLGVDDKNHYLFNKRLNRTQLKTFMQHHPPVKVVMEACYSSHYWARLFEGFGHRVKLIPAQHVKPFVRGNKNDTNDTLAILEASQRPNIRPVPVKTEAQQEILMLHRIRERLLRDKAAVSNQIRGILVDFGISFARGNCAFEQAMRDIFNDDTQRPLIRLMVNDVYEEYCQLKARISRIDCLLRQSVHNHPCGNILMSIPGIGPIIASAFLASIDKGQAFNCAKDFAVWLGLTPKQVASGHKSVMTGISKRGDAYLRKQLIHGARAIIYRAKHRQDTLSVWITQLRTRKSACCTAVATAHKLARLMWVLLQKQTPYVPQPLNLSSETVTGS